jgi:hypothetical protein
MSLNETTSPHIGKALPPLIIVLVLVVVLVLD